MRGPLSNNAPMQNQNKSSFDAEIGRRLQMLRIQNKFSQVKLGSKLGVTFQQIQKYEKGFNTISLHKLLKICTIFDIEFSHFIDHLGKGTQLQNNEFNIGAMRAMVVFSKLNPKIQKSFLGLMEAIQNHDEGR